jgi:hypothetical protein
MLTKTDRDRLIKVCKVLFPEYKRITVDRDRNTVLFQKKKAWFIRWFFPKLRLSVTEVIEFRIPKQLADFKYGNVTFINQVQEDLVRCEMNKQNKIDYFLEEITKMKYSDIYKQLKVAPGFVNHTPINAPSEEDEMFDAMILLYREKETTKPIPPKSYWVSREAMFYTFLLVKVLWSCIRSMIP